MERLMPRDLDFSFRQLNIRILNIRMETISADNSSPTFGTAFPLEQ